MFYFYTPREHKKTETLLLCVVLRGYKYLTLETNGLIRLHRKKSANHRECYDQ